MATFMISPLTYDMKHAISTRWLANAHGGYRYFPHFFGARMKTLIFIKATIHVLIK